MPGATGRREAATALLEAEQALFCCPVCGRPMRMRRDGHLLCKRMHGFDLSRSGYLNLTGAGSLPGYDRALFESRSAIFAQGFYDPLADAIARLATERPGGGDPRSRALLDAGCGEGFYLARLHAAPGLPGLRLFGVDLSRDAVALASRRGLPAVWCVADLAALPFRSGSFDLVLNLLAPANYGEFRRVLRPDGALLKVLPGNDYLREIRAAAGQRDYVGEPVLTYALSHLTLLQRLELRYVLPVTGGQAADFYRLTPMTAHRDAAPDLSGIREITLDFTLLLGFPK